MSKDYSETGLYSFLDYLDKKHLLNKETLRSRRTAAQRLLSILEAGEKADLRSADIDDLSRRYANHPKGKDCAPRTLQDYQRRLKSLFTDFFAYIDDPVTFKTAVPSRASRSSSSNGSNNTSKKKPRQKEENESNISEREKPLVFPVPIRPGVVMQLVNVPTDLSESEAERVVAIVKALSVKS